MRARLIGIAGLVACLWACDAPRDAAARVTVKTQGFRPGCVQLVVEDAMDPARRDERTLSRPVAPSAEWVVAVFRGPDWSRELRLTATAREQSCDGPEVARVQREASLPRGGVAEAELILAAVDLDGDGFVSEANGGTDCDDGSAAVHPQAIERCNGRDDDCDGLVDEGFGIGMSCSSAGPSGCPGAVACSTDGGVVECLVPPEKVWFPDRDGDGFGASDAGVIRGCGAWGPDAGQAAVAGDCDDTRADIYPGAPELCDGVANACGGRVDEGFNVGRACEPGNGECPGTIACAADGGATCRGSGRPKLLFTDADGDGQGAGAGTPSCAPPDAGQSLDGGDCDDSNPWIHASAPELCDAADNDCDRFVDEGGVCAVAPGFVSIDAGSTSEAWISSYAYQDGGNAVVIAGTTDDLRIWAPGDTQLRDRSRQCVNQTWEGLWVDARTGNSYLAGRNGWLAVHPPLTNSCFLTDGGVGSNPPVSALHGFLRPQGVLVFTVTEQGQSHVWDGGSSVRMLPTLNPPSCLEDVHGLHPGVMFAVGGDVCTSSGATPVIFRFDPQSESWVPQPLPSTLAPAKLVAVHVVHERLAYAVGGTITGARTGAPRMAIWDGDSWSAHSTPSDAPNMLTGVVAFGRSQVFVTGDRSVWRFDGTGWLKLADDPQGDSLWDVTGSSPDQVWVVGDRGSAFRWPR